MTTDQQLRGGMDLLLPIYIDTNVLLDLLASIEGGFTTVEKVTTRTGTTQESEKGAHADFGTEFGILNVLNLLKINVGGMTRSKRGSEAGEERASERYHTYGSLLFRLRSALLEQEAVKSFDGGDESWEAIHPSDFVELRGVFRPNPMADSLRVMTRLLNLAQLFSETQIAPTPQPARHGQQKQKTEVKQLNRFEQFLKGISSDLEAGDIRLLVMDLEGSDQHKAIVTLFVQYLRDPSMTELAHNQYRLLGKVVRKVSDADTVDLLRGTALGGIGDEAIDQLTASLNTMQGLKLPSVETSIAAPALQVVPVAIYV